MPPRKRTATRRKATRSVTPRRRTNRRAVKIKLKASVAREIWAIIYMGVGIITILSLQGAFGIIGDGWVSLLKPVVGWGVYVVPAVFIIVSLMLFLSKKVHFGASKILGLFVFMGSVLSLFHLSVPIEKIHDYAALGMYGGYTGFVTNFLVLELLGIGRIGAAVLFAVAFIISLVLVFEISIRDIFKLIIPEIHFEKVKETTRTRKEKEEEMNEYIPEKPEILIHKAQIRKENVDVIYEEDEDVKPKVNDSTAAKKNTDDIIQTLEEEARKEENIVEPIAWEFPSLDLLKNGDSNVKVDEDILMENADRIKKKLDQFGINVVMHEVNVGPTVIQYTLKPDEAVKLSKITSLKNDIALALAAERVRIEAPIPGKSLVGIEVPNKYRTTVHLREILESKEFSESKSKLTLPLGRDVTGKPIIGDLSAMPHLLIAGATGSGKSVCMNTFLTSLLYQNSPQELKFILIDPKRVELSSYNNIPHLLAPVITDPEKAAISLRWVVAEMIRRYSELHDHKVRNVAEYNDLKGGSKLPRIIVVVDELADLMMAAGKEVEASICRIAQMARAVGIHLILATQRPSVDVITGLIKANIPSRISFAVSSSIDSRTILDGIGAEDLVGMGDMLYLPTGQNKPRRVQGIYVSTDEIERVTNRVKLTVEPDYDDTITSDATASQKLNGVPNSKLVSADMGDGSDDPLYAQALELVRETRKASASLFQRRLKVGYARAARLVDILEENGVVGPADGAKPRKIMVE